MASVSLYGWGSGLAKRLMYSASAMSTGCCKRVSEETRQLVRGRYRRFGVSRNALIHHFLPYHRRGIGFYRARPRTPWHLYSHFRSRLDVA